MMRSLIAAASLALCVSACGSNSSNNNNNSAGSGSLHLNVKALNAGQAASTNGAGSAFLLTPVFEPNQFVNGITASGAPSFFSIAIESMSLQGQTNGNIFTVPIFSNPNGKSITINGSTVDLTSMFTQFECVDNNGQPYTLQAGQSCACGFDANNTLIAPVTANGNTTCPQDDPNSTLQVGSGGSVAAIEAQAGEYTQLNVTFSRVAQIQGCVTGNFATNTGLVVTGLHTYCTQSADGMVNGQGGNANSSAFEVNPANAQVTDLDLLIGQPASQQNFTINYPLSGLTLSPNSTAPLTLLIDINRMLRFYVNENRPGGFGPNTPGNASYFYNSIFDESVYLFAGQPGSILGYQLVAEVCVNQNASVPPLSDPAAYDCSAENNGGTPLENVGIVAAWLTVVENPNGQPFMFNIMPDDDDALTVLKGNNQGMQGWDSSAIATNSDGSFNFTYSLSSSQGTLFNIDPTTQAGAFDPNVYFQGFPTGWFAGNGNTVQVPSFGIVSAWRRL